MGIFRAVNVPAFYLVNLPVFFSALPWAKTANLFHLPSVSHKPETELTPFFEWKVRDFFDQVFFAISKTNANLPSPKREFLHPYTNPGANMECIQEPQERIRQSTLLPSTKASPRPHPWSAIVPGYHPISIPLANPQSLQAKSPFLAAEKPGRKEMGGSSHLFPHRGDPECLPWSNHHKSNSRTIFEQSPPAPPYPPGPRPYINFLWIHPCENLRLEAYEKATFHPWTADPMLCKEWFSFLPCPSHAKGGETPE